MSEPTVTVRLAYGETGLDVELPAARTTVVEPTYVAAAEDQLTVLESSAKDEADGARAGELRNAVRDGRARVGAATSGVPRETWGQQLNDAIARLESALAPDPGGPT